MTKGNQKNSILFCFLGHVGPEIQFNFEGNQKNSMLTIRGFGDRQREPSRLVSTGDHENKHKNSRKSYAMRCMQRIQTNDPHTRPLRLPRSEAACHAVRPPPLPREATATPRGHCQCRATRTPLPCRFSPLHSRLGVKLTVRHGFALRRIRWTFKVQLEVVAVIVSRSASLYLAVAP